MTGSVSQELLAKHGHKGNNSTEPHLDPGGNMMAAEYAHDNVGGFTVVQAVTLVTFGVGIWEVHASATHDDVFQNCHLLLIY